MPRPLDFMLRESADLVESGLGLLDGLLRHGMAALGPDRAPSVPTPPSAGPQTMDDAVADAANRAVRLADMTALDGEEIPAAFRSLVATARHSFGSLDRMHEPAWSTATRGTLSAGTLALQQALRALSSYAVLGERRYPEFLANVVELFDDNHVFVTLQYREMLQHYLARLERTPDDARSRLELGRTYTKCGLYHEAASHLQRAAQDPAVRAGALHELSVAHYRAGLFAEAVASGSEALALAPSRERTRLWLWLAAQRLGGYPSSVPEAQRMTMKSGRHPSTVTLEEVAATMGLNKTSGGRGSAVFDYDGDGYLDVLIAAAHAGASLYHNNGDGTFTDVSISSRMDTCINGFVTSVADYDNDGRPDVFVTRLGFFDGDCSLYRNNGDGTFSDVTAAAGLTSWGPGFTASWADYDGDGFLDLFVANNLGTLFERKTPNRLFHNNGDGTFTEVSEAAGLSTPWPTIGSAWGDYDNDGRPDLFVSNAMGRSQLFHNNGDGTFTDVSRAAGVDGYAIGSVAYWIDYDDDGWLDLVQYTWSDHEDVIHTMRHGEGPPDGQPIRLYHNNRDGTFTLRSREMGITGCWGTMSGNAGDINNDGHVDIFLGNGSPRMDRIEPLTMLERGPSGFRDVTFAAGLPFTGKSHGVNLADLGGDGRLCLIIAAGGAYPGDLLTTTVYRPVTRPGHYLNVRLVGTTSNRDAIGARLVLHAGQRQMHRLVSGGSQFGCLPFEQHFGLGDAVTADALDIWWPSGLRQRVTPLPVDTTIRVVEGDHRAVPVYSR